MTDTRTQVVVWAVALGAIGFALLFPPFSLLGRLIAFFATGRFF